MLPLGILEDSRDVPPPPQWPLGLTPPLLTLTGPDYVWSNYSIDVSAYAGAKVRVVFRYATPASFYGDIQADQIELKNGSTVIYSAGFETDSSGWQTTSAVYTAIDYPAAVFYDIPTPSSGVAGRFNRRTGGTPSSGTGVASAGTGSYYIYAEVSGWFNRQIWARGAEIQTDDGLTTLNLQVARSGSTMGDFFVHLYVSEP